MRLVTYALHRKHHSIDKVCMTPECISVSAAIMADADFTANPCDDFFQFTCGGWVDEHELRSDQSELFTYSSMTSYSVRKSKIILESTFPGGDKDDEEIFGKATSIYKACMDTSTILARDSMPLYDVIEQFMVTYPVAMMQHETVQAWLENNYVSGKTVKTSASDLTAAMLFLQKMAVSGLMEFSVEPDDKNPDYMILKLYQILNGLPSREYYARPDVLEEYTMSIRDVLVSVLAVVNTTLTAQQIETRIVDLAKAVVELETEMASYSLDM